jgi:hypothetical protein
MWITVSDFKMATYLVVGHTVTTSSRRALALGLETSPFSSSSIQVPKIVVVVECTLLGRREFTYSWLDIEQATDQIKDIIGKVLIVPPNK